MAANNGYHGQQQQQYSNVRALLQQQQQQHQINNFCVSDEYYQSLDNLAFCLDDFFVPDNDSCAQAYAQYAEKKPSQEQMQQKVHQSLLVSQSRKRCFWLKCMLKTLGFRTDGRAERKN